MRLYFLYHPLKREYIMTNSKAYAEEMIAVEGYRRSTIWRYVGLAGVADWIRENGADLFWDMALGLTVVLAIAIIALSIMMRLAQ